MGKEHKVAEQRPGLLIEHGEIVIGVRGRQAFKVRVRAPRSILIVSSTRSVGGIMRTSSINWPPMIRRMHRDRIDRERQCPRQVPVTDEHGSIAGKQRFKDVIRMAVRVDDVPDRRPGRGSPPNSCRLADAVLVSITVTALSPTTNPILAVAPSFSRVMSAVTA